jgi:hypothetical protein
MLYQNRRRLSRSRRGLAPVSVRTLMMTMTTAHLDAAAIAANYLGATANRIAAQ